MLVIEVIVFVFLKEWKVYVIDQLLLLGFLSGHMSKMYLAKMKHFEIQIMTNIISIGISCQSKLPVNADSWYFQGFAKWVG